MRIQYHSTARVLHWLTVLFVVVAWAMARFGLQLFDEGIDALHTATTYGLGVHIWAGLAVLVLAMLRFRWRMTNPPPPAETNAFGHWLISWTDPSARLTHYLLYILLFTVPVLGILLMFCEGKSLSIFGIADPAPSFMFMRSIAQRVRQLHVVLANVLVIVATFHAAAVILHHAVCGDGTFSRMLPWPRANDPKVP